MPTMALQDHRAAKGWLLARFYHLCQKTPKRAYGPSVVVFGHAYQNHHLGRLESTPLMGASMRRPQVPRSGALRRA
jgi:hypothetical protein